MAKDPWALLLLCAVSLQAAASAQQGPMALGADAVNTGPRSPLPKDWVGLRRESPGMEILVLAGHADAQGIAGAGTAGAAVGLRRGAPMQAGISDELYWNLVVARAVVAVGTERGLPIRFYEPPLRTIRDGDDPRTNWSEGRRHSAAGGYALEIHFDAYGPDGVGSGLIPALHRPFSRLDESLAQAFGAYPLAFRGGLGGPRRGISLLEIGKLEWPLEQALRDPLTRQTTVTAIANRVVNALARGLQPDPPAYSSAHGLMGFAAGQE